ncbi:hypothetical protein MNV49_007151 [Pseudohyphozyma bogoriensis]|nr:hypothetical protein MNV49_007151 [Pseudohyphozyma bogoriensis]
MPAISSVPPREPSSQPTTSTVTRRSSKRSSATFRLGRPQAFPETFIAQRMSLESFTAEELSAGNEAGAEEAADPDEWARQRRMSSLLSGLGLVFGTTALTTTIVEAEEVEAEEGDLNLGSDISYIVGYPTSPMPDSRTSTSASSPESESEAAFESAEEGDEDASRSASRVGSERVRSREPSEPSIPESKPFSPSSLSTIVDNSPVVTHFPTFPHTVTQATPVLPSAENESVSIEFGYALDGQTLGQGLKEEPGELSDEDAPSSVKQLLRQSWRLSNGSHDFTPAEEKRLSDRAAERLELDDLSNLSLHITDMVSPRSGSLSSYKPSARPPFSRASSSAHSSTPGTPLSPPLQPFPTTPTPEKADGDRSERTRYPSSTMTPAEYETMSLRYGRLEMRRQEVIWELCETEKSFVAGLCGVIRVFTLPLRTPEGAWIKGVPVAVSRLFDWLQDIVFLHSQISAALQSTRISNFVVSKIADAFLPFVSRLEVHQPYLVRFEAVTKAIDEMTADAASDFGEFVRMQSSLPECAALSLSSFLLKPVQRLMKYPLFFKQLCDLTPATHPDHIATLSLLHSTDSMIRVMQEVKTREDEYEEAKILESRIRGLPEGFKLARRDRRLVAHGPLRRVHINDKDRTILEMDAMARAAASAPHRTTSSSRLSPNLARLSPDHYRDSVVSDSGSSINSMTHSESSAASWASPSTPGSSTFESLEFGTFSLRLDGDKSPKSPSLRGKNSQRLVKTKAKESSVFAFVFSDLVVLTTKSSESSRFIRPQRPSTRRLEQGSTYKVLETVGLSRVLGVSDLSGKTEHDHLIEVDLLPVAVGDGQMSTFSIGKAALATSIYLTVPSRSSGVRSPSLTDTQGKEAFKWIQAFERSYLFALRSLSFPTLLNGRTAPITQNEYLDTPTPFADGGTSPSLHSFETFTEDPSEGDKGQQAEREERAWWAVRLKQVRKELELTVDGKSSIARLEKWKEERVVKVPSLVGFAAGVGGGTTKEKEKEREKLSRKKSLKRGLGLGDIGF